MSKKKHPTLSVIIRTKNEEKWIGRCLESVFSQKVDAEIEVVLVDNNSTDHTVGVANRYPVSKFINISDFLPGKALNDGIRASTGDFLVCISAHCIPQNNYWLDKLLFNVKDKEKVAGVYGRQLPLSFTDPLDKRDLLTVFGLDRKIQKKDYFFHNANSMIPRSVWERFPFDEEVTNIEDRVWGKEVIKAGYNIIYEPEASVYHYHGLHQGNNQRRARGVVSILERVEGNDMDAFPEVMLPEKINIAAIIPIVGDFDEKPNELKQLQIVMDDLKKAKYVSSVYCLSDNEDLSKPFNIKWLDRNKIINANSLSLNKLLMHSLKMVEKRGDYPESILYVNRDYLNRPKNIFDELITDSQYKGCDTVFPGLIDYGHYWYHNEDEIYKQTDPSLKPRANRDPVYKALYGLGCLTASRLIRKGEMVGGKVGILKIVDPKYALRANK